MRKTKLITLIEKILDDNKTKDIISIDVTERTPFADFYTFATCANIRHLDAVADKIKNELEKNKFVVRAIEGKPESGWMLVDCGSVIVHLFTETERERISLDKLVTNKKK